MAKLKTIFVCSECGAQFSKWIGQCNECGGWNTIVEETVSASTSKERSSRFSDGTTTCVQTLAEITLSEEARYSTCTQEFDRVLGGGLTKGSVVLLGGDPGIGKSTLLLQTLCQMAVSRSCLYISGEESLSQIRLRAKRLGLPEDQLKLLTATEVDIIIATAEREKPEVMVIDSIQTMYTSMLTSAAGSVSQVRESAARLVQYAKQTATALFLVGHVTKEGHLAGPRVLEHMVDTVLYFEGDSYNKYRLIRAVKNRFGAINELGVFAMTDQGLREVIHPSAIFLTKTPMPTSGSIVTATWEGSRPLLLEVQALVDESHLANPRRVAVGFDYNRLSLLLAVLHRHGGIATYNQDVFVNIVGGLRIIETAIDVPIIAAIISSLKNRTIPKDWILFGEIGLGGEVRPVQNGMERLKEAEKHGFKKAIIPSANIPKKRLVESDFEIISINSLSELFKAIFS